jgi:epoxide hydrolase 4
LEQQTFVEEREAFPLPPGCDEGFVVTNGIRLHYVAAGQGPLALLLHGFPEFWYSWRDQLTTLAPRRRVVALDLRGYNLSEKPPHGYDLATLAADVRGAIEAFGERQADIIGHDWGGVLAWAMGIREPDYVRRLVVLNAPHLGRMTYELRHPGQMRRSLYAAFFQLPGLPERALAYNNFSVVWRTFRTIDPGHAWLADQDIARYVAAMARPGALHAALTYYRELMRHGAATLGPVRVITAPTLLFWGELDPYLGPALADGLDEWVRDVRVKRFPTLGHWINQQEPERINDALLEFLT